VTIFDFLRFETSLCVASNDSQGHGGSIWDRLHTDDPLESESESVTYGTTDGQSASLSWNKAPIWGLRPDFYYFQTAACLLMWDALSDERTRLSFTIAAGLARGDILESEARGTRDHILLSQIRDFSFRRLLRLAGPWWRYTTRPPLESKSKLKLCYDRRSVGQSVLVSSTHLGLTTRSLLLSDSCGLVDVGRSLWREDGSVVCQT
jgi:hypothetical protein